MYVIKYNDVCYSKSQRHPIIFTCDQYSFVIYDKGSLETHEFQFEIEN